MRLQLFRFKCGACGNWFEAPEISELTYGEFLLRSRSGEMRYLNANFDSVFLEVDAIIGKDARVRSFDQFQRADILNAVFGSACDPDSQGFDFRVGEMAPCSFCNQHRVVEWESVEPVWYVDVEVPKATHCQWRCLSKEEKHIQIRHAIDGLH